MVSVHTGSDILSHTMTDCLVIRASSMSRLNLNVLWNDIGSLFNIKSNINKVT